jgi:hypothetical protein
MHPMQFAEYLLWVHFRSILRTGPSLDFRFAPKATSAGPDVGARCYAPGGRQDDVSYTTGANDSACAMRQASR